MNKIIAHIDMDCFFAAVEEKYNPELKGKPLVIGGSPEKNRGVVATANYEARKYGIHSAMSIKKAFELNPKAIFVRTNKKRYKEESIQVMNILKNFSDEFQQVSVDEAYLDITKFVNDNKNLSLREIARIIKKEVYKKTRLTCSIGISNSKYVSKIASDFNKPVGTTIVENNKEFLRNLKVSKIPGVGKVLNQKFRNINIQTIKDLAEFDKFKLIDLFGNKIIKLYDLANGIDKSKLEPNKKKHKSISCEETYEYDIQIKDCFTRINYLATKIQNDLKDNGFRTISIKIRFSNFKTQTRDKSVKFTINKIEDIIQISKELLKEFDYETRIRLFGIKISNIKENYDFQKNLASFI